MDKGKNDIRTYYIYIYIYIYIHIYIYTYIYHESRLNRPESYKIIWTPTPITLPRSRYACGTLQICKVLLHHITCRK